MYSYGRTDLFVCVCVCVYVMIEMSVWKIELYIFCYVIKYIYGALTEQIICDYLFILYYG